MWWTYKCFLYKKLWIKNSDKLKDSEFLEEVFAKCENCSENFKTTQCVKDQNLSKIHIHKCDQYNYQNNNEKRLK